jgi:hypothetical protein
MRPREVPEEKEIPTEISININKKELYCAFTLGIFIEPAAVDCGHIFDNAEILAYKQAEEDKNAECVCPKCRSKVTKIMPAIFFVNYIFRPILAKYPDLQADGGDKDLPEEIAIQIKVSDLYCPLNKTIFYHPVTVDCGHVFEADALDDHRVKNRGNCQCACCDKPITQVISASAFVRYVLDPVLAQIPELNRDVYFKGSVLLDELDKLLWNNSSDVYNQVKVKKLLNILRYSVEKLNGAIKDTDPNDLLPLIRSEFYNLPPLTTLASIPLTRKLLFEDPQLLSRINTLGFNQGFKEAEWTGASAFYFFTATSEGRAVLRSNPQLLKRVTTEGLHQKLIWGEDKDKTPAYWLRSTATGRQILRENSHIRKKIEARESKEEADNTEAELHPVRRSHATFFSEYSPLADAPATARDQRALKRRRGS